jgi:hypothetical protein
MKCGLYIILYYILMRFIYLCPFMSYHITVDMGLATDHRQTLIIDDRSYVTFERYCIYYSIVIYKYLYLNVLGGALKSSYWFLPRRYHRHLPICCF